MYEKYKELRDGLGFLACSLMVASFILSFFFSRRASEAEQTSFFYNLALLLTIGWVNISTITKLLMLTKSQGYLVLNVLALILFASLFVVIAFTPSSGMPEAVRQTELYQLFTWVSSAWIILWIVLDVCEVVFLISTKRLARTS